MSVAYSKGISWYFFKSACQVQAQSVDLGEGGGGWKESGEGDTEEGGAGVIPAHLSDSHLPQRVNVPTALRLLHGRLAAHPSPSLPSSVQSCIGTLCLCLALGPHQSLQGSWGDRAASASPSHGSAVGQLSHHGSLLLPDPPQVQEEEEETLRAQRYSSVLYLLLHSAVCQPDWVLED